MILINSAAYVSLEFQAEIGIIPPCMLPIGNKKLIEFQVEYFTSLFPNEEITVSIPESYHLSINETRLIDDLHVFVIKVPDEFCLAESILYVMNVKMKRELGSLRMLHGDTLIKDLPKNLDVIAIAQRDQNYNWHQEFLSKSNDSFVWAGYFSFSSRLDLLRALAMSKGDFVKAIDNYRKQISVDVVEVRHWYDCGHINTYFDARANITTQRSFNSLSIDKGVVTKSSQKSLKMQAEINWFKSIPASLKKFRPQFIDHGILPNGNVFYQIEFLSLLPLNELYVHGRNPASFWRRIFNMVQEYFIISANVRKFSDEELDFIKQLSDCLYNKKTRKRFDTFIKSKHLDISKEIYYGDVYLGSVNDIINDCINRTLILPCVPNIMHGDLCFSNMLLDVRGQSLKLIDPRGVDEDDRLTILGNQTYDLAKLTHSVIGMYDFIIAGRYQISDTKKGEVLVFDIDDRLQTIQAGFLETQFIDNINNKQIVPAVVLLFLSMLPLHDDRPDRQHAMLLNAFRLYHDFVV